MGNFETPLHEKKIMAIIMVIILVHRVSAIRYFNI